MHLRKSLATAAAIVAAGVVSLSGAAFATGVTIGGSSTAGSDTISGEFKSGTATFAGSTYSCSSGIVSGTVQRGNPITAPAISFTTASVSCATPLGNLAISLNNCTVPVSLPGPTITTGVDISIAGTAAFGTGTCVKISALFGICTANVHGTVNAIFNETVKTGGWQDLILNGSGTLANQSGCGGLYSGTFTLYNIEFNVKAAGGAINFVP